ncbi:MAG: hypothetical protein PQJ59_05680 [Spirochaetales bacterium]|nr:hypothetical protein [Spirochaetales bacterium]
MDKRFFIVTMLFFLTAALWSQSLQDNEYYRKMVQLKTQSEAAFDEGDYGEAKRLAEEAQGYKELSDQWIETQLAAYRARSALNLLKKRVDEVTRWGAEKNYPEAYAEGTALYKQAYGEFHDQKDYPASLETSRKAIDILSVVAYVPGASAYPAFYTIRLLPGYTDCLWNIAGYDFIYGDPLMWNKIYEANKSKLPDINNPDFVLPEIVLTIPALSGETRSGTWVDGEIR